MESVKVATKLTKSRTQDIVNSFNGLDAGETLSFTLPEFHGSLTLCKGLDESRLLYKNVSLVIVKHKEATVIVSSEPYTGVFTYILPLITRLLYAKVPLSSGQLEIP